MPYSWVCNEVILMQKCGICYSALSPAPSPAPCARLCVASGQGEDRQQVAATVRTRGLQRVCLGLPPPGKTWYVSLAAGSRPVWHAVGTQLNYVFKN